jgi:hypothetical protein
MIINCTPHQITICDEYGNVTRVLGSSSTVIRLKADTIRIGEIDGIPLTTTQFGEAQGLPEYRDGVFLIVSQLVKAAFPDRKDLLVPSEIVRDKNGNIIGCRSLGI